MVYVWSLHDSLKMGSLPKIKGSWTHFYFGSWRLQVRVIPFLMFCLSHQQASSHCRGTCGESGKAQLFVGGTGPPVRCHGNVGGRVTDCCLLGKSQSFAPKLRKSEDPIRMHYTPEHCPVNGGVPLFWCGKSHMFQMGAKWRFLLRSPEQAAKLAAV